MPKVLNKHKLGNTMPLGSVYIGRPSKWGNPFIIDRDGTREEVIAKYREYIMADTYLRSAVKSLKGLDLVCWCAPQACHGDVLLELANG